MGMEPGILTVLGQRCSTEPDLYPCPPIAILVEDQFLLFTANFPIRI